MPALVLCVNQIAGIFLGKVEIDVINATSRISQEYYPCRHLLVN